MKSAPLRPSGAGALGTLGCLVLLASAPSYGGPVPGGSLNPNSIKKFQTPLVIPPVMNTNGTANTYDIAVRQFKQQILPKGMPATTVWSYGPAADPTPVVAPAANSQFNYPAYTIENTVNTATTVTWINDLVVNPDVCSTLTTTRGTDPACNFLKHLTPVDRTLHWANPEKLFCTMGGPTDCRPDPVANGSILLQPYDGPVPITTHVHGAHVTPESDGYPESWWLPNANNIPLGYATTGRLVNMYGTNTNSAAGRARFTYGNVQPSATLWYHDHTLGMTRNNVYAGPAGFWLIRNRNSSGAIIAENGLISGTLPGPAPTAGQGVAALNTPGNPVRAAIREIPIAIQDRSFNNDGSLFYPDNRAFFEGVTPAKFRVPVIGSPNPSDISPIWNPESFFNVMVVNGVAWPKMEVEPDLYRFRLLNGCNSRFLNLSLHALDKKNRDLGEVPFYQIGAEQSLLPAVVRITTGFRTALPGDGSVPSDAAASSPDMALLMGLAERADVLVDFANLPPGTVKVRMLNTAPDAPFGGFPDIPADPGTTGQVMEFVLVADTALGEGFTAPAFLRLSLPDSGDPASGGVQSTVRHQALLEEESELVCATVSMGGRISWDSKSVPDPSNPGTCIDTVTGALAASLPWAPKAAVLGTNGDGSNGGPTKTMWSSDVVTNPALNTTETWEIWNHTVDGHPIHLHLVKFKVVNREAFDPATLELSGVPDDPEPTEAGWKDTVIAYPGQVTRVNATFDIAGLYVWHCHIVEHEDNEMMVPYCVGNGPGCNQVTIAAGAP